MNLGLSKLELQNLIDEFKGDQEKIFIDTVHRKDADLLKTLLKSPTFKIKYNLPHLKTTITDALKLGVEKQDTTLVKLILLSPMYDIIKNEAKVLRIPLLEAFCDAAEYNDLELLRFFIGSELGIDYRDDCALNVAVNSRNYEAIKIILEAGSVLPGTTDFSRAVPTRGMLLTAVANDDAKTVNLLMSDKSINLSFDRNILLKTALENGYNNVLHFLLIDGRIDPGDENNIALCIAARNGNFGGVKQLLEDPRVKFPSGQSRRSNETNPLICAMQSQHNMVEVLSALMKDPRSDPNSGINYAIEHDIFDAIDMFLNDPRTDLGKLPMEYRELGEKLRSKQAWNLRRVWKLSNEKLSISIPEQLPRNEKILLVLQELDKLGYLDIKTSKLLETDQFASAIYSPERTVSEILKSRGLPNRLINVDGVVAALLVAYLMGPNRTNTSKILEDVLPASDYQYLMRSH